MFSRRAGHRPVLSGRADARSRAFVRREDQKILRHSDSDAEPAKEKADEQEKYFDANAESDAAFQSENQAQGKDLSPARGRGSAPAQTKEVFAHPDSKSVADAVVAQSDAGRITFPFAEDKDSKFRNALKADQDPNIYLVDRSGNVRYAQVDTSSMEEGAAYLVKETAEQAADYPKQLVKRAAEADKKRWLTKDVTGAAPGHLSVTTGMAVSPD